ncbi:hypothetical protein [Paenibacillus shenyangensis]|uniref:hypothetical protein n=1 Tax=Paenibacillus sp. A9 TaxID=1284352 RepID=UPI000376D9C1|nr:hypothetical protein [Paenibacillus sp. A9]
MRLHELKQRNYFELFPGVLFKGYGNEESIYIDDESFSFITPAIQKGFESYRVFERFEIGKSQWHSIIKELLNLRDIIDRKDRIRLKAYISTFFWQESVLEWKLEEYEKIDVLKLMRFIEDLIEWIESQLEDNDVITLIGL